MLSSIFIGCDALQSKRFFTPSNKKNTVKSGQSAVQGSVAGLLLKRSLDVMFQSLSVVCLWRVLGLLCQKGVQIISGPGWNHSCECYCCLNRTSREHHTEMTLKNRLANETSLFDSFDSTSHSTKARCEFSESERVLSLEQKCWCEQIRFSL